MIPSRPDGVTLRSIMLAPCRIGGSRPLSHAALLALALSSCASVRSGFRDLQNVDRVGEPAPEITGIDWVIPEEADYDESDVEEAQWKLLVLFKPN